MSLLAVLLASLLFFSGFAVSGIVSPECSSSSFQWTFNSLGQEPCKVAAYLLSTCNGGSFTIPPLPSGSHYIGPTGDDDSDLCKCNTVVYNLLSACDACQGEDWITWELYKYNCTKVLPAQSFPNPVPSGIRVPYWALLGISLGGGWDDVLAFIALPKHFLAIQSANPKPHKRKIFALSELSDHMSSLSSSEAINTLPSV